MLKRAVSELAMTVMVEGRGHLLIKDGRYNSNVKLAWGGSNDWPAMVFINRNPFDTGPISLKSILAAGPSDHGRLDFYLPGSSVRGAWRSHLEKVLRSLDGPTVCDPLIEHGSENSCSARLQPKNGDPSETPYRDSCPVCKLFGDTAQGSRVALSDGELKKGDPVLVDNVAIRRQTGSVAAPFKSLVLRNAKFELSLRLRNFELWQVGLLAHLFDDLGAGRVPLGAGKNKGWGVIAAKAAGMTVTYFGREDVLAGGNLKGLAELSADGAGRYEFIAAAEPPAVSTEPAEDGSTLWRNTRTVTDIDGFWKNVKRCFDMTVWKKLKEVEDKRMAAHG